MGTGAGTRLMYVESEIAEKTMLRVLDETGAIVLPVHDSFIVHQSYRDDLELYMREEFKETLGQPCDVQLAPMELDDEPNKVVLAPHVAELAEN